MSKIVQFPKNTKNLKNESIEEQNKKVKEDLRKARTTEIVDYVIYFSVVGFLALAVISWLYLL